MNAGDEEGYEESDVDELGSAVGDGRTDVFGVGFIVGGAAVPAAEEEGVEDEMYRGCGRGSDVQDTMTEEEGTGGIGMGADVIALNCAAKEVWYCCCCCCCCCCEYWGRFK